jgi:methylated-DNA-protein-cysteine methyltransferase-like protein
MKNIFSERVIALARSIPFGRVTTYGLLAKSAGSYSPLAARSVTGILGKAYESGITDIPFHRIVYSDGRVWTHSSYDEKRKKLYKKEGIEIGSDGKIVNFRDVLVGE